MEILPLIFSFLFFLTCGSYIFFGWYVVSVNSKEISNRLFFVLCIFLSVWAFGLAMSILAPDMAISYFWRRVSALGWCTFPAILLHFFLILTQKNNLLKKWWIYFLIYTPAAIFIYVFSLSHDLASLQYNLVQTTFGWVNSQEDTIWNNLFNIYFYGYIIIGLGLLWKWGKHTRDERNQKQARLILYGFGMGLVIALILEIFDQLSFLSDSTQKAPNIMFAATVVIFYSIKKYSLVKMKPISKEEIILNKFTRIKIYNYLSVCFVAGSLLNILSQYFLQANSNRAEVFKFSAFLMTIALAIQIAQRAKPLKKYQNYINMALIGLAIPIITFEFIDVAGLTVWAFPFILIIVALVYNNRVALVGISISIFLTQIFVFITMPHANVEINSKTYIIRMGLFGIAVWVAFFVNQLYVERLRQNAKQIKIQKMLAEFSADFLNVNQTNFNEKTAKWLKKSSEFFDIDRACICFFNADQTSLSCRQEWCHAGVASQKELHQDFSVEEAPEWIDAVLKNKIVYLFNHGDHQVEKSDQDDTMDGGKDVIASIPIAFKGNVQGFLAFFLKTEKDRLSNENEDLLEIIAHILADAMLKIEAEKEINYRANYDQLTGMPNRLLFKERLNQEIELSKENKKIIGIIFLDIDSFKTVNDTMGHEGGDELLVQVIQKIMRSIKKTDTVSRFEGDQILIMLKNISREKEVVKVANRITNLFNYAFIVNGQEFYVSANLGISVYPTDGETADELIKNADIAKYKAKEKGKNQFVLCSTGIKEEVTFKNKLINRLYRALENNELIVYYQPQINLATGKIVGVEALIRWQHPEFGMIPPKVMIPLAEQTGLINPIGEWILQTACRQNKAWQDMGLPPVRIAINVSATQFRNPKLISQIKNLLKETDLKPKYCELELTENIAINNSGYIISILNGLKKLGVIISIDDFGTEYSSLSRLKELPIDQIKIDKQFIDGIAENVKDQTIVNTIILLARNLGLSVIAEGAETEKQINFLKEALCDTVQGFYYYQPMPAIEIETLLRQNSETP